MRGMIEEVRAHREMAVGKIQGGGVAVAVRVGIGL